jgi:NAD(P)-dependent dehydrogenase (short-subunit alcohol dehydrogenase family)
MNQNPGTYLVVGGTSAIGKQVIEKLLKGGHTVVATSRNDSTDRATHDHITWQNYDATSSDKLDLPKELNGVIYCPGTINLKPFQRLQTSEFMDDLQVNTLGAVDVLQQSFRALKKANTASVVLFSSVAVQTGMGFHASIALAKGALEGLTRSLAAEWAGSIRVNAIAPSLTDTPLAGTLLSSDEKRNAAMARHPTKSIGDPKGMAELAHFLLSDHSKFMTGQILGMDGGLSSVKTFV